MLNPSIKARPEKYVATSGRMPDTGAERSQLHIPEGWQAKIIPFRSQSLSIGRKSTACGNQRNSPLPFPLDRHRLFPRNLCLFFPPSLFSLARQRISETEVTAMKPLN